MFCYLDEFLEKYILPVVPLVATAYFLYAFHFHIVLALYDKWNTRRLITKKQRLREEHFKQIEARYPELTEKAKGIISLTEDQLLSELQERKLSAVEVLEAFICKAMKDTRKYNAVTEFLPGARLWAKRLDEMEKPTGPLHGLPISVKENCNIEGTDSTLGFGKNAHKPKTETSILVNQLMDLGAIPFCKTNVPQTLFTYGCGNPIFGETRNCHNPELGPGGSSGGEGSLIGSGGSLFGIGTDAAGSVRIPAHFCGCVGFRPTKLRLSPHGFASSSTGIIGLAGVAGLMGKSAGLIKKVFKHLTSDDFQYRYDRQTIPLPWNEEIFSSKRPLRIGYFTNLPFFPLLGDAEEVTIKARDALEDAGHILIPFEPPNSFKLMKVFCDLAYAEGGKSICEIWKDEPIAEAAVFHFFLSWIPKRVRVLLAMILESKIFSFFYSPRIATMFRGGALKSRDLILTMAERKKLLDEFVHQFRTLDLDLVLSPTFPLTAIPINYTGYLKPAIIYTLMYNVFDCPAGVVRFGTETGKKLNSYDTEGDLLLKWAHEAAQKSVGMPITVQLAGLPFNEEKVLRGMMELERLYAKMEKCC